MEKNDRIDAISKDLVELGTVWAKLGLSIGRQALEASAKSLTKTSALLGQIADAVDGKKPDGEAKGAALSATRREVSRMADTLDDRGALSRSSVTRTSRSGPHSDGLGQWLLATLALVALSATVMMEWWRSSGR